MNVDGGMWLPVVQVGGRGGGEGRLLGGGGGQPGAEWGGEPRMNVDGGMWQPVVQVEGRKGGGAWLGGGFRGDTCHRLGGGGGVGWMWMEERDCLWCR